MVDVRLVPFLVVRAQPARRPSEAELFPADPSTRGKKKRPEKSPGRFRLLSMPEGGGHCPKARGHCPMVRNTFESGRPALAAAVGSFSSLAIIWS